MLAVIKTFLIIASMATAFPVIPNAPRALPTSLASLKTASLSTLVRGVPKSPASSLTVPLPAGQSLLTVPAGQKITAVTVGRGIQNYTCTNGVYVSAGALANLYDVSGILSFASKFTNVTALNQALPNIALKTLSYPDTSGLPVFYHHDFVTTPGATTGISPKFFSTSDQFIGSKSGSVNAPENPATNVPWLQLTLVPGQGTLANTVYRLFTAAGQPPTSCTTTGESLSVQYAAMYYFLK